MRPRGLPLACDLLGVIRMTATVILEAQCPVVPRTRVSAAGPAAGVSHGQAVSSEGAVDRALRLALAFEAEISEHCRWTCRHRLADGDAQDHRITHLTSSLARGGWISALPRRWPVASVRLAESPGEAGPNGATRIEILVAPIRDDAAPKQVAACLYALRVLVHTLGIASPGDLRCAAHVTLTMGGTACTIVDMDRWMDPARVVAAELRRQSSLLSRIARVSPALVGYDEREDRTLILGERQFEVSHELTDPDHPPLRIDEARIARLRGERPALR